VKSERSYEERFNEFENDVDGAFLYLLNKLEALWSEVDYHNLQKICIRDIRLSEDLKKSISDAETLEKTINLLKKSPYLTWFEIRILHRMAIEAGITEAKQLIKCYKNYAFSKPCSAVRPYFYPEYVVPDHLTKVISKLNVDSHKIKVNDLIDYCLRLDSIDGLSPGSSTLINNKDGCMEISTIIPAYYSYHAFDKAKCILLKFRSLHVQYHQIGSFAKIYTTNMCNSEENQIMLDDLSSSAKHCT